MTDRPRPPTDDVGIAVIGASRVRSVITTPTGISMYGEASPPGSAVGTAPPGSAVGTAPPGEAFESFEAPTEVNPRQSAVPEQATPTEIDPQPPAGVGAAGWLAERAERSEPIRVFSMKAQTEAEAEKPRAAERVPLHAQLRSMAEVARSRDTPAGGLGHLAPPRAAAQPARHPHRDVVVRLALAVGLACAAALAIWLIAG